MIARTALVTGANRGLGLETARQLGAHGLRVILTSRNEPEGYAAAHELVKKKRAAMTNPAKGAELEVWLGWFEKSVTSTRRQLEK